jgi:phosphoribosylglycinamide formyltransferase-1
MNIGFLISHRGSNMQAVIDACTASQLDACPCVVISNNSRSEALVRARNQDIPYIHLSSRTHPVPEQLDLAIASARRAHQADLVILAGYMKKLGDRTLSDFSGRILNIHPGLLPKCGGQGMYGRNVHEAVLAAGEKETGVTIHVVDGEYDHGRILAECRIPIAVDDDVATLSRRVLEREHELLVGTLIRIISGSIRLP